MRHAGRELVLSDLRARIARVGSGVHESKALPFGLAEIDRHLPGGGLALGHLHDVLEAGAAAEHAARATLFVAGILGRLNGPVLWCVRRRDLFAPALGGVGLHPDRVIYAEAIRDAEILPCMEEGLRQRGLAGVVGEVARLGLTPSRRLQLAAEASGVTAFVIRRWRSDAERAFAAEPSAATTRWRIGAAPSGPVPGPGLGRPHWLVELTRARGAEARSWILEACDAEGRLAPPAGLADGPPAQSVGRPAPGSGARHGREDRRAAGSDLRR
jgi:protein ImuA